MDRPPLASRALLFPGPQPPLTHLGATLLRHVLGSGLRYALYQLGLPMPDRPPVRISRLRLYLDAATTKKLLADVPGGAEIAAALLDPAGVAEDPLPGRPASAAAFHRVRLRLTGGRRLRPSTHPEDGSWAAVREALAAVLPGLNDALLADVLSSLGRRAKRRLGHRAEPVASRAAAGWLAGRRGSSHRLGAPDLYRASWAERPELAPAPRDAAARPQADPLRGRFRESYRAALDILRPFYSSLAEGAVERGVIGEVEEAFFIPFDLAADLELDAAPDWIAGAVATNRAEYEGELTRSSPLDTLAAGDARGLVGLGGGAGDWRDAPLALLP